MGALLLLFLLPCAGSAGSNRDQGSYPSGTTPWGVLNALGRDAQLQLLLKQSGQYRLLGMLPEASADVGDVAVINADATILMPKNPFDLSLNAGGSGTQSVTFAPAAGGGYTVKAGPKTFEDDLVLAATPVALQDDDTKDFPLGFAFTFFGKTYSSVNVNSDGNLTFGGGDVAMSRRDLSRFLTGLPRIAPFFSDLNPNDSDGQILINSTPNRFTVTWAKVRSCCSPPAQPYATFQVSLYPDGHILFAYQIVSVTTAVVGISPGSFFSTPEMVDFSAANGAAVVTLPIAETFQPLTQVSETAVARKFFAAHDDAYDFLFFFHNITDPVPDMHGAFAFEMNVANDITGIGDSTYSYTDVFGSEGHLSSMVNMGLLSSSRFPPDPSQTITWVAPNSTLSVMAQEAGHKWLTKFLYPFNNNPLSNILLGRDNEHWSFFFNSDASDMEGNRIRDNGDGTFSTVGVVEHYNTFDHYGMGLIPPEQVQPSFVVVNPSTAIDPGNGPRMGVTFSGTRMNVTIDKIIQANGPRLPHSSVTNKNFRFAFVLLNGTGTTAPATQVAQVDTIRLAWEGYWNGITNGLSVADTHLLRGVSLRGLPGAVATGAQLTVRLHAASVDNANRLFTITASGGAASAPASVTIPAGARDAQFTATGNAPGITALKVTLSGHETAEGSIAVVNLSQTQFKIASGDAQVGSPSSALPQPLVVKVLDGYSLPVAGVRVQFTAPAGVQLNPPDAVTDEAGLARTSVTLGPIAGMSTVTAAVSGSSAAPVSFKIGAVEAAIVPAGSIVNGASFTLGNVSPGSIISIFGSNLAATTESASGSPLPTKLAGVTVTVGGVAAPLYFVSPGQINLQVPFGLSGSTANVVVNNGASSTAPVSLALSATAPGVFMVSAQKDGAVLHADYSLVQASNPARAGETILIYCTGLGGLDAAIASGAPAPMDRLIWTTTKPVVTIGGLPATLSFWGLAPGYVGLYQVNAVVPSGVASGPQDLVVSTEAGRSAAVKIAMQ